MSTIKLPAASGGGSISIKGPSSSGSDVDVLDTSGNLAISGNATITGSASAATGYIGTTSYGGGGNSPTVYISGNSDRALKIHNTTDSTSSLQLTNSGSGEGDDNGLQIALLSSDVAWFNNAENADMRFATNGSEKMRIGGDGLVHIGCTSEPSVGDNGCRFGGGSYHITARDTSASAVFRAFGGDGEFRTIGSGNCQNTNNSYGSISDRVLKENEVDASSQWNDIKALKIKNYNLKSKPKEKHLGVIAQDLEAAGISGLVENNPDELYTANDVLPEGKNLSLIHI